MTAERRPEGRRPDVRGAETTPRRGKSSPTVAANPDPVLYERLIERDQPPHAIRVSDLVHGLLERAGVPPRYQGARFGTFRRRLGTPDALRVCREVHAGAVMAAALTGPPGTGKTHLAVSVLAADAVDRIEGRWRWRSREAENDRLVSIERWEHDLERSWTSRFVSVPRLLEQLRRGYRSEREPDLLEDLERAELLVLDDLGVEKVTDWTVDRLTTLIGIRYDEERQTIVTSNYDLEQLADRGYDRIVSRLLEDGPHVRIQAADYRLERRAS